MNRTPFVAGNWKMNTNKTSAVALAKAVAAGAPTTIDVGIAPPFVYLDAVGQAIANSTVLLGAQDAFCEDFGAFTGEICTAQLRDIGVKRRWPGPSSRTRLRTAAYCSAVSSSPSGT